MGWLTIALIVVGVVQINGFAQYAPFVPNGNRVPNPCPGGGIWAAVGHITLAGGGARNAFGTAFVTNNYEWTPALCRADSDGDGRSNGAELGDPQCLWVAGSNRRLRTPIGHPGICEPVGSARCLGGPWGCGSDGGITVASGEQATQGFDPDRRSPARSEDHYYNVQRLRGNKKQ